MFRKSFFFCKIIYKKKKPFSLIAKGLEIVRLPRQNDYRTFCMSEEIEKVYHELEKVISTSPIQHRI